MLAENNEDNIDLRQSESPRSAFKRARDKSLKELSGSFVSGQLSSARIQGNSRSPSPLQAAGGGQKFDEPYSQLQSNQQSPSPAGQKKSSDRYVETSGGSPSQSPMRNENMNILNE